MVIIRADGNAAIGAGHLMRCLTIADIIQKQDKVLFVCADEESAQAAQSRGYRTVVLSTDYRDMESELPLWENVLSRYHNEGRPYRTDGTEISRKNSQSAGVKGHIEPGNIPQYRKHCVILVDSYYVTDRYLEELRSLAPVVLLDDMAQHAYPVTAVVNYNAFAQQAVYAKLYQGTETMYYVGSSYIPVREQFLHRNYQVRETVRNVLITTGGGDQDNIAGRILETLSCYEVCFHVVTGRYNPYEKEWQHLAQVQKKVFVYNNVENMAELMERCDLAVTAGGTTVYELAAVGVPFICFSYACNQEALAAYVGEQNIAGYAGAYHQNGEATLKQLRTCFEELIESFLLRRERSSKQKQLVDGLGAARVAKLLVNDR